MGRLSPEKRVSTILNAWTQLSSAVQLLIIGGGPEAAQLEKEAASQGLTDVHFKDTYRGTKLLSSCAARGS